MNKKKIEILECTLRDGSYSVDFKFTLQDTALLARLLSDIGFRYIEVAHGVGLGAARAGKGETPWPDEEAVRVAKSAVGNKSLIGVFCIPGIAQFDDMKRAADAGLDFVRIGQNAPVVDTAIPYINEALKLGIKPCVNFMKSYGVTAADFGEKVKMIADSGAEIVFMVDSAGGMFPDEIARYFDEARKHTDIPMGFHGHNNLYLVIANCLEAVKHGATFVDSTLYGLGRSAGNAPTEILVAIFKNLEYDIGAIDLFRVMDVTEAYMEPLINQIHMYDMMSVTAGYSLFHSSYLPKVAKMAQKYKVELRRLVAAMGKADPVNCPDDVLESLAKKISGESVKPEAQREILISFNEPGFEESRISNTLQSANILIDGIITTAAKRNVRPVLDLAATNEFMEDFIISEFVQTDQSIVLGRIRFGSWEILQDVLRASKGKIAGFLIDKDGGAWADIDTLMRKSREVCDPASIFVYSSRMLHLHHLCDYLVTASCKNKGSLIVFGISSEIMPVLNFAEGVYETICLFKPSPSFDLPSEYKNMEDKIISIRDYSDWKHLRMKTSTVYFRSNPSYDEAHQISHLILENGTVLFHNPCNQEILEIFKRRPDLSVIFLDRNEAYKGQFLRWSNIKAMAHERFAPLES
ncbi:hypothetical protein JW926_14050 [Candidatus Sumerlaeota bacterium]|nr:hypothetical protein [Candidatus Sumerlaeota bacterium]